MARITLEQTKVWLDKTKVASVSTLDQDLLTEIETEVLARLGAAFDTSTWTDSVTTPRLVQTVISKVYAAWYYHRVYSEDVADDNTYAAKLEANAEMLIVGLINGTIDLPEVPDTGDTTGLAAFYPTDESSAMEADSDDRSLGPEVFSMGTAF